MLYLSWSSFPFIPIFDHAHCVHKETSHQTEKLETRSHVYGPTNMKYLTCLGQSQRELLYLETIEGADTKGILYFFKVNEHQQRINKRNEDLNFKKA